MIHSLHLIRRLMKPGTKDTDRLHTLAVIDRDDSVIERVRQRRQARQIWIDQIEAHRTFYNPEMGFVYGSKQDELPPLYVVGVLVWSRDCDHVCGERKCIVEGSVASVDEFCDRQLDMAEGPMRFTICAPDFPHRAWSRDMVLEAYEDGHPHSVRDAYYPED